MKIKDLVKDNFVEFDRFKKGIFYYRIKNFNSELGDEADHFDEELEIMTGKGHYDLFEFQVPIEEIGDGTMFNTDKAITFMKWINKALKEGTLIKL